MINHPDLIISCQNLFVINNMFTRSKAVQNVSSIIDNFTFMCYIYLIKEYESDKMRREEFRSWLEQYGRKGKEPMSKRPIDDALSRCSRVEKSLNLDLDTEYKKDGGDSLVDYLEYTSDDERLGRPAPEGIEFETGANIKNGMASLRSATKKYFEFCEATKFKVLR